MRFIRFITCGLVVALVTLLPAGSQSLPKVRIIVVATEVADGAVNAAQLGYFKDAGLDAEVTQLANGGAAASAILSGQHRIRNVPRGPLTGKVT